MPLGPPCSNTLPPEAPAVFAPPRPSGAAPLPASPPPRLPPRYAIGARKSRRNEAAAFSHVNPRIRWRPTPPTIEFRLCLTGGPKSQPKRSIGPLSGLACNRDAGGPTPPKFRCFEFLERKSWIKNDERGSGGGQLDA